MWWNIKNLFYSKNGFFGNYCENICPENYVNEKNEYYCQKEDGKCEYCKDNLYYRENCTENCPINCKINDNLN